MMKEVLAVFPLIFVSVAMLVVGILLIRRSKDDAAHADTSVEAGRWQPGKITFETAFSSARPDENGTPSVIATVVGHRPLETGGFVPLLEYAENGQVMRDEMPPITVPQANDGRVRRFQMAPGQKSEWARHVDGILNASGANEADVNWGGSSDSRYQWAGSNPPLSDDQGHQAAAFTSGSEAWHPTKEEMESIMPTGTQIPLRRCGDGTRTVSSHVPIQGDKVFGILLTIIGGVGLIVDIIMFVTYLLLMG